MGGCARLLLAGGMLNITATYSRIISATGRFCAKEKGEGTVDVLALEEEGRERERVVGEDGRPPRFGRLGVISSTFTGSALPRFRGMMNLLGSWPCPCPRPPLLVRGF